MICGCAGGVPRALRRGEKACTAAAAATATADACVLLRRAAAGLMVDTMTCVPLLLLQCVLA